MLLLALYPPTIPIIDVCTYSMPITTDRMQMEGSNGSCHQFSKSLSCSHLFREGIKCFDLVMLESN